MQQDDLSTFEGWLRYQGFDAATATPDELAAWRDIFDEVRKQSLATPKIGLMKLRSVPGEHRYAVSVREGSVLSLTLWVRCSPKGEFFVMVPREELRSQVRFAAAPNSVGRVSGNREPRVVCWARPQRRRSDLRSDHLLWSCRSCAWRVGAARWRSCS